MAQITNFSAISTLETAVRCGHFLNFGGPQSLVLSSDFLVGLYGSFVAPQGAMYEVGFGWSRALAERLEVWAHEYQAELSDLALEDLLLLIQDELTRGGWGRFSFDLERLSHSGLILAIVSGGPIAGLAEPVSKGVVYLLSGFLAGLLGQISGLPMEAVGHQLEAGESTFAEIVVGHEDSIIRLREALEKDRNWTEALSSI